MGLAKEKMMSIKKLGYGESNKYVCSGCLKEPYLQKMIRTNGKIVLAIDYYYMSTLICKQKDSISKVKIGSDVWIAAGSSILKRSKIEDGAVGKDNISNNAICAGSSSKDYKISTIKGKNIINLNYSRL
ncbi:MAG: hypothetical protein KH355_02805 [Clostridiales bacterium]|nr:hypothetical protein [Clostridiales bacterium]